MSAADTVIRADPADSDATVAGSRRVRPSDPRVTGAAPVAPASRQAYAPDTDALRAPAPIRPAQPLIVPRRTPAARRGDRPIGENGLAAPTDGAGRLARRRMLWLVVACLAAAAAAASVLVLVLM